MKKHALREAARGKPCMFRGPFCDGGGETTVLGHLRFAGLGGIGMKVPDICGIWICGPDHDVLDGRRPAPGFTLAVRRQYAFDALLRTLNALHEEGLIP